MSATLSIAAILTLKDQLSAPLRAAQSGVAALAARIKDANGAAQKMSIALGGVASAARRVATLSAQAAAAGQLATGFGLETYARNALDVEHRLAALGNTASMSSDDLKALYDRLKQAARATNQFTGDLLTANEQLIAAGLEWRTALDITPVLGKVATATQATMGDLAQTAYALSSNLRVPAEQMQAAFERLTVAGQSGQFELKDMAREFAKLGASMGALQFTGLENVSRLGAALQIARRGAGDASEAANNLQNFLAKLAAPDVQKNFAKFGIDLPRLLKTARERGLDPFLVTLKAIQKATGGDEFKLGELFGDMQVQNFIKPMLLYADDYKKLVAEIDSANGVIEGNFTRMMGTTAERWKQFRIQLETTPMPWLDALIDKLSAIVGWMSRNEELAGRLATGLVALGAAAAVFGALSVTLSGISAVIGGIGALIAMITVPIGLVVAAIAGAAYLTWRYWDTIKAAAMSTIEWMRAIPSKIVQIGRDLIDGLINGIRERWQALKDGVSSIASGIADTVRGMLGINSPSRVFAEIGGHLMDGLSHGIERTAGLPLAAMRSVATGLAVPIAAGVMMMGAAGTVSAYPMDAGAAAISITVNLNGPATPEAANDIAAAVRREVERALAESARRDALARRAAMIDGGLA